jgi:hypothetical protein
MSERYAAIDARVRRFGSAFTLLRQRLIETGPEREFLRKWAGRRQSAEGARRVT